MADETQAAAHQEAHREAQAVQAADREPTFPRERTCPFAPPAEYARWQAEQPVAEVVLPSGQDAWLLTRHQDVRAMLDDPRFSADSAHPGFPRMYRQAVPQVLKGTFLRMDGADHLRYRRMLGKEFTAKGAKEMRPLVERTVDGLLDRMAEQGSPADLVTALAYPVPSTTICGVLGVPYEDRARFEDSTRVMISGRSTPEEVVRAKEEILGYLTGLVAAKEREPGDDLISRLLEEQVATGELDRDEVPVLAWLLLAAGHDTTASMIGLGALLLMEHADQLAALRSDPGLVAGAVEELLRHQTIMQIGMNRVALEDVRIGDRTVRAGEGVVAQLMAANRDPEVFADPDRFDITRSARGHVAFGYGPHQCLGQMLARVELQVTLARLFERFPKLRTVRPVAEIPFRHHMFGLYGVTELMVEW
ncbi:cytochrome P450 [Saccharothrix sp. ST-888]|uniref:cytochrome P450 n=1 Tax=Saccharothrix sp. ST-888 TaxID=1427391 RepID=UPI0005EC24AE|nr:cytochrome P450 [Saccharothrix sp. ST-888]